MESERAAGLSRTDATLCEPCTEALPAFVRATAFGTYGGTLRTLIHLYKFEGIKALAAPLGERLGRVIERLREEEQLSEGEQLREGEKLREGDFASVTLIAVPMYRGKRGYNQSVLLADAARAHLKAWHPDWKLHTAHHHLRRIRKTESQSNLTPDQRRKNVRGAFAVTGDVSGQTILLVDDVYTTGATAGECTRVLLEAGAARVDVVTLARTQKEQIALWEGVGSMPTRQQSQGLQGSAPGGPASGVV